MLRSLLQLPRTYSGSVRTNMTNNHHCNCSLRSLGASILNCNLVDIKNEVTTLVNAGIDFVHLDVMDGNFVDDITFGPSYIASLVKQFPSVFFEVHMMVSQPMKFIEPMAEAGVRRYIFHYEVTKEFDSTRFNHSIRDLVGAIMDAEMQPVIGINPSTKAEVLFDYFHLVQTILVMTVVPGKGGQKFMAEMMEKVRLIRKQCPTMFVEVDGGVGLQNVKLCGDAGVTSAICGTSLLRAEDKFSFINFMRDNLAQQ